MLVIANHANEESPFHPFAVSCIAEERDTSPMRLADRDDWCLSVSLRTLAEIGPPSNHTGLVTVLPSAVNSCSYPHNVDRKSEPPNR